MLHIMYRNTVTTDDDANEIQIPRKVFFFFFCLVYIVHSTTPLADLLIPIPLVPSFMICHIMLAHIRLAHARQRGFVCAPNPH